MGTVTALIQYKSIDLIPSGTGLSLLTSLLIIPVALFIAAIGSLAIGLTRAIMIAVSRFIEPGQIITFSIFWLSSVASVILWFILPAYPIPTLIICIILVARYLILVYESEQQDEQDKEQSD